MDNLIGIIEQVNNTVNSFVWGPVMLLLLVGTGVYLSIRTGFFQFTKFGYIMRNTVGTLFGKERVKEVESGITPFQAVSTALAGTVGTGNITGIATAITIGGPGAVFWMWVSALFGMVTKYAEIVLAIKYREKKDDGHYIGGPMLYIEKGLKMKWLAVLFAIFCVLASFGIGNMTQANSIAQAVESTFHVNTTVTGVVIAIVVALVILGGITRIASVNSKIVPFMAVSYIVGAVIVLALNASHIPAAFGLIFECAFKFDAAAGGVAGYTIMTAMRYGFARGVFSNEAGLGSAPIAHAAAHTDNPVKQGLWGVFEVFFDTIIICTLTALVILISGLWGGELDGAALSIAAFDQALPGIGGLLITVATIFFATSTILGWAYYGERAIEYLLRSKTAITIYRVIFVFMIVLGARGSLQLVWGISDTLNGMMAIPNLIGIIGLSGVVISVTKEHFKKEKDSSLQG